jgi:hypothetical protein
MELTGQDFEALSDTKMQWAGYEWETKLDRFANLNETDLVYSWAYWFDCYAALVLARTFLINNRWRFSHSWDEGAGQYILVTDYVLIYGGN